MTPNRPNHVPNVPVPATLAGKLLAFCLHQRDMEAVIGDFEQEYYRIASELGARQAMRWYWLEVLRSMPALLLLNSQKLILSKTMNRNSKLALSSSVFVLPAFLLVLGGVAQSGFGTTRISDILNYDLIVFRPIVIMGGLSLAVVLNLLPVVHLTYEDGVVVTTLTLKKRLLNLALLGSIGGLSAIIFLYLIVENLPI